MVPATARTSDFHLDCSSTSCFLPAGGKPVVAGAAIGLRDLPFRGDPSAPFEPVQGRG